MNIAKSTQLVFEEIVFKILNELHDNYKVDNLVLSGGCSFNSSLNGKILENTNLKKYIFHQIVVMYMEHGSAL